MKTRKIINHKREFRQKRNRARIRGIEDRPRLSVFKSNKYIYAQLINDLEGKTILSISSKSKMDEVKKAGVAIAEKAKKQGIEKIVFDRGRYAYHGLVKAFAEGAREGGLKF